MLPPSPGQTLCCKCIVYSSILQIALLSWIYMLLSPPRETGLAINSAQGSAVPWSENKCWSIIVLCLPIPPPPPPSLPSLLPQSLYKPRGLLACIWADGAKWDRRHGGVWIRLICEGIDRYWGYRTVKWMLMQHLEVFRSHSCQTETRTWVLIDCIMASLSTVHSASFSLPL